MKKSVFIIALLAIVVLPFGKNLMAQTHNVKLELGNLLLGDIRLDYEHILNENNSVMLRVGGMIPHSVPDMFYDPSKVEDEYGGTTDFYNRVGSFTMAGEYRFYTKGNAPDGFYWAPYLRYTTYNIKTSIIYENTISESEYHDLDPEAQEHAQPNTFSDTYTFKGHGSFNGGLRRFGGGVALGYQWLIGDNFTIDWTFLGLGIERWTVSLEAVNETEGFDPDFEEWGEEIDQEADTFFFLGDKLDVETEPDRVKIKLPMTMPSIYGGFSIGYAF
jgi:hypothetical protein